jgi:hypothetical protein
VGYLKMSGVGVVHSFKQLYEYSICSICYEECSASVMLKCGHGPFCEPCLAEWLNRKHCCPICRKEATVETSVVPGFMLDSLFEEIRKAREHAKLAVIEGILGQDKKEGGDGKNNKPGVVVDGSTRRSGISAIRVHLQTRVSETLGAYESYMDDLTSAAASAKLKLELAYVEQRNQLESKQRVESNQDQGGEGERGFAPDAPALVRSHSYEVRLHQLAKLTKVYKANVREIEADAERSIDLVVESFKQHMDAITPSPFLLPVSAILALRVLSSSSDDVKGKENDFLFRFPVTLKPTESLQSLIDRLTEHGLAHGDRIIDICYDAHLAFHFERPFRASSLQSSSSLVCCDVIKCDGEREKRISIHELLLPPQTRITLVGHIVTESSEPKECHAVKFKKEGYEAKAVQFYQCTPCKARWICEACAENCHTDCSGVSKFVMNKPTWAVCKCKAIKTHKCRLR